LSPLVLLRCYYNLEKKSQGDALWYGFTPFNSNGTEKKIQGDVKRKEVGPRKKIREPVEGIDGTENKI